jgi:hypothetical protein
MGAVPTLPRESTGVQIVFKMLYTWELSTIRNCTMQHHTILLMLIGS